MILFVRPAAALAKILSILMNTPYVLPSSLTAATAVPVTGFITDPNYPDTVGATDGLMVDQAGTIVALVQINFGSINHNRGMQLTMNGSVVGSDYLSTNRTDFMVKYTNPDSANKFHQILVHTDAGQTANRTLNYAKMFFVPTGAIGPTMRMEKDSVEYSAPSGTTWGAPIGFTTSSGFGSSVVHNNALIGIGTNQYNMTAQVTFPSTSTATAVRILVNGVIIATSPSGGVSQTVTINGTTINPGDVVSIEVNSNGSTSSARVVQPGSTFLQINAV